MTNPWFRLYHEFSKDPIIQCLAFEDQRHFVIVLCMKCDGTLDRKLSKTNRERIICRGLGLDPNSADEAKRRLMEMELIDKNWQPVGWETRQYESDNSTKRVRKHRKNKDSSNVTGALPKRDSAVSETPPDTDTDTDKKSTKKTTIPDNFSLSQRVIEWGEKNGHRNLDQHLDNFILCCESKGYKYVDWDAAFMRAVRDDWAKLKTEADDSGFAGLSKAELWIAQ